jgi:Glycosyltransferase sugar-binding region containing DXD motif
VYRSKYDPALARGPTERKNSPIVQYWHDRDVPDDVAESIATFRDRNPQSRHMLFDEAKAERFIADRFDEREVSAFRACAVPAMQSDYFSYCALLELGGLYSDIGFRCLRTLPPLLQADEEGLLLKRESNGNLINGFFAFGRPGHPLLRLALDVATVNIEQRVASSTVSLVTGPWVFTALFRLHRLGSIDAIRQQVPPGSEFERPMETLLETVGDPACLTSAFESIRIEPLGGTVGWIEKPSTQFRYKRSEADWVNWRRRGASIYR